MLSPASFELASFYTILDEILKIGFAPTSYGEFLEMRCAELGVFRKPGTYAVGELTFTGDSVLDEGKEIPEGTTVSTGGDVPLYFLTTETVVMSNGVAIAPAMCEVPGLFGNVRAEVIDHIVGDLANLFTVTNVNDFHSGSDDETDEDLLSRYNDLVQRPVTSGNENHYLAWSKSVAGIGDARVRSNHSDETVPVGTVELFLLDSSKLPASQTLVTSTYDYIETVRPVGATVRCVPATGIPIEEYLRTLAFKDPIVRYSQIANKILDVEDVLDYSDLLVNGGTGNITIGYTEVAVKGEVTFV
jgi:uncharacterized phage protein gp47/JayE